MASEWDVVSNDWDVVAPKPSNAAVLANSLWKGIASVPDAVLNTPTNIANLGIAAISQVPLAFGPPDLVPNVIEQPNFVSKGLKKVGLINDIAPATTGQRILDVAGQGVGGALINPANSVRSALGNMAISGLGGAAGQAATEVTGSPIAGALASMATPAVAGATSAAARSRLADLLEQQSRNAPENAINARAREQGFVTPPSAINPSGFNKILESIGGKAAITQESQLRNQEVINDLSRAEIGIPANKPITEGKLDDLRKELSAPYKQIAEMPVTDKPVTTGIDSLTNQPKVSIVKLNPPDVLQDLKVARENMRDYYNSAARTGSAEDLQKARSYKDQVNGLEKDIDLIATQNGKPELVADLQNARREIAKTYSVEKNLNVATGDVSGPGLGRNLDKGAPLSGNLLDIANFSLANPKFVREAAKVPTPGVSKLEPIAATGAFATGHPLTGGVILAGGPARALALSKWYQNLNAQNAANPLLARALSNYSMDDSQRAVIRSALQNQGLNQEQQ